MNLWICTVFSLMLFVRGNDRKSRLKKSSLVEPQQVNLDADVLAATEGIKSSRRRERITRHIQRATQRSPRDNHISNMIRYISEQWQGNMERRFKKLQHEENDFLKNQTGQMEATARITMKNVQSLGERMVRNEQRNREDMNHLTDKSKTMETRLERLEKLLEQRTQEDYYISAMENDYPNDAVDDSDIVEALQSKLGNLEKYVREVWNVINMNYKQANLNKQTFINMSNEISRLDNIIEEMKRETTQVDNQYNATVV